MRSSRIIIERNCALPYLVFIAFECLPFGYSFSGYRSNYRLFQIEYFTPERLRENL